MEQTRRDIEQETRRALDEIRKEVADLTCIATEKVTRKSLDADDQQRLIEEALAEVDFSRRSAAPTGNGERRLMEEIAQVYARALFEAAEEHDVLDDVHEQLGEFADALAENQRAAGVLLLAATSPRQEKKDGDPQDHRRRRRALRALPRAARRAPPACRRSSASGARSTSSGARRTSCCR